MSERFEYRGQWIGQEGGRSGFYRYWYDTGSRRVKRRKLKAVDFQSAKEELISIVGLQGAPADHPGNVSLIDCLAHYLEHYATPKGYNQKAAASRAFQLTINAIEKHVSKPNAGDLSRTMQQQIWTEIHGKTGNKAKSIKTHMILVRAALNYCAKPQIINGPDGRTEVQLLTHAPVIFCNEQEIADHLELEISAPRSWIPTYQEFGRWIDAIENEADFRFVVMMLNTAARNEALFDLDVSKQVDYRHGTIDLNPPGRRQTKKKRPLLRLTTGLAAWFQHWNDDKPIHAFPDRVEKRLNRIGKTKKINLPEMTCYTIRHFMATQMRRTEHEVTREQRSKWLGHEVNQGSKTTDWYETFDPDYLEAPMKATESIIRKLDKHTHRKLFAPTMHPQASLREIKGSG